MGVEVGHLRQEPSVCLHWQEICPQERDGISSLGGAPRKHGARAGVVDILPTQRTGGDGTHAFHAVYPPSHAKDLMEKFKGEPDDPSAWPHDSLGHTVDNANTVFKK